MKPLRTWVNDEEWTRIREYCRKRGISIYRLVKDSVFLYMEESPAKEPAKDG